MPGLFWLVLPLPFLSLGSFFFAIRRKDADPKQRGQLMLYSGLAGLLGIALAVLVALRG